MCLIGQTLTHLLQDHEQIAQLVKRLQPFLFPGVVAHDQTFQVTQTAPSGFFIEDSGMAAKRRMESLVDPPRNQGGNLSKFANFQ